MSGKSHFGLTVLLAFVSLFINACDRAPAYSPLPPGSRVLAFGDSVTFGTGAAQGEDYPARLAAISGWAISNKGIPGETTAGAKARIAEVLEETAPALVLVEIGGNDFLRRLPEAEAKENIRSILRTIRQAGVPAVLVGVPNFSVFGAATGSLSDADLYAELAKEEGVPLLPSVFADVLSDPSLKSDQIHPNGSGYRKLAEGIAAGLVESGLLAKH